MVPRDTDAGSVEGEGEVHGVDKREYTQTFDGCAGFCDNYNDPAAFCTGLAYYGGYCMAYDAITGTFHTPDAIAAIRQNVTRA